MWRSMREYPQPTGPFELPRRTGQVEQAMNVTAPTAFYPRDRDWHPPALTPAYKSTILRSPKHAPVAFIATKSELTGPVFGDGILGPLDNDLIRNFGTEGNEAVGQRLIVHGRVLDENGNRSGTLIEIWQANAGGRYRHKRDGYSAALDHNFGGCGRTITDETGSLSTFAPSRPGAYPVAQRRQRLATRPYPFFFVRPRLLPAAHYPDVFRRRSDDLAGCYRHEHS